MAISAVVANISLVIGSDKTITDTVVNAAGEAQNITGWSLSFVVHGYGNPLAIYITKTTGGGGITITNGVGGVLAVSIERADTLLMYPGSYDYVIRRTDSGFNDAVTVGIITLTQV